MKPIPPAIVVLGQTPPPYGGQAMMIARLVDAHFERLRLYHIRMSFSDTFRDVGRFQISKLSHALFLVCRACALKLRHPSAVLYYPPAGPTRAPILRDLLLLFPLRFVFPRRIYHFRAAGLSTYLKGCPPLFRRFARWVYGKPELAIQLSDRNPSDGEFFHARRTVIIPNGVEDSALGRIPALRRNAPPRVLYVGVLTESKGILDLLTAATLLRRSGTELSIVFVGQIDSSAFERQITKMCLQENLNDVVSFRGVQLGEEKWQCYADADIFCFPSFFHSESFGNVLLEAMSFQLPIVATDWRGIADVVEDGKTGFLVPVHSPGLLAEKLSVLLREPELRHHMGKRGRERYLEFFTLDKHLFQMEREIARTLTGEGTKK